MPAARTGYRSFQWGFSLVELLIVVAILAILASLILIVDISGSLKKGRDSKRKQDLNKLVRLLEDYYNDHQRYPQETLEMGSIEVAPWGKSFTSYSPSMPADPLAPHQQYYYLTDPLMQNMFALFALLENPGDPDIISTGCEGGCGPGLHFNYVVHSSNVVMLAGLPNGMSREFIDTGGSGPIPPGGGGGNPTSTPIPTSTVTPTPSLPVPPTPVNPLCEPGDITCCNFTKCGYCHSCGSGACWTGWSCDYIGIWQCKPDCDCPGANWDYCD